MDREIGRHAKCSGDLRTLSYKAQTVSARKGAEPIRVDNQDDLVEKINMVISLVNLQLNPFGEIDKNIIRILAKMPALRKTSRWEKTANC